MKIPTYQQDLREFSLPSAQVSDLMDFLVCYKKHLEAAALAVPDAMDDVMRRLAVVYCSLHEQLY